MIPADRGFTASCVVQVIPGVIKCNQGPRLIWHRPIVFAFGNSLWNYSIWKIFRFDIYMLNRSSSWELLLRHAGGGPDGNRGISAITNASKTEHKRSRNCFFLYGNQTKGTMLCLMCIAQIDEQILRARFPFVVCPPVRSNQKLAYGLCFFLESTVWRFACLGSLS